MKRNLVNCYMYFYHTDNFIVLPSMPESITDSLQANFNSTNLLSRSAPIFTYSNSGPRTIQVSLALHRDLMNEINYGLSNFKIDIGDDYIDTLIKQIQAVALPRYDSNIKLVDPPIVALRFSDEIFIKGVVTSGISIEYNGALLENNRYSNINISFTVSEIDPIDAETIQQLGSWRPIPRTLERRIYRG